MEKIRNLTYQLGLTVFVHITVQTTDSMKRRARVQYHPEYKILEPPSHSSASTSTFNVQYVPVCAQPVPVKNSPNKDTNRTNRVVAHVTCILCYSNNTAIFNDLPLLFRRAYQVLPLKYSPLRDEIGVSVITSSSVPLASGSDKGKQHKHIIVLLSSPNYHSLLCLSSWIRYVNP
jgi:hypothetical protein